MRAGYLLRTVNGDRGLGARHSIAADEPCDNGKRN